MSACNSQKHEWLSTCRDSYILYALLLFIAAQIYGMFGYGVRSAAMDFAFAAPLLGGIVEFCIRKIAIKRVSAKAWEFSKEMLRVSIDGFVFFCFSKGIFDIAGAPTLYPYVFFVAGVVFFCVSVTAFTVAIVRRTVESTDLRNL